MTTEAVQEETVATDAIYFFARNTIHPDPEQPREVPDAELQASIDAQGIIQPITVRPHPEIVDEWMIVDGARRYAGSVKLEEIPCRIRLDLEDVADRVVLQLTANTGKPLTPIEEARALRKVLDASDPQISTAELARRTGMARSTVQDRLGLLSIPEQWLKLLNAGELQSSHAPAILPFKDLPATAHAAVVKALTESWQWQNKGSGPLAVDKFNEVVRRSYEGQLFPLGRRDTYTDVTLDPKDYDGLVITYQRRFNYPVDDKPRKYAADPAKWRPIVAKAEAAKKKESRSADSGAKPTIAKGDLRITLPKDVEIVKGKTSYGEAPKGLFLLTDPEGRWNVSDLLDFEYIAAELPASAVVRYVAPYSYGIDRTATRWDKVIEAARERWNARWADRRAAIAEKMAPDLAKALTKCQLVGPGARTILLRLCQQQGAMTIASAAGLLEVPVPQLPAAYWEAAPMIEKWLKEMDDANYFSRLLSAVAAIFAGDLASINDQIQNEQNEERDWYRKLPVPWIEGSGGAEEEEEEEEVDDEDGLDPEDLIGNQDDVVDEEELVEA